MKNHKKGKKKLLFFTIKKLSDSVKIKNNSRSFYFDSRSCYFEYLNISSNFPVLLMWLLTANIHNSFWKYFLISRSVCVGWFLITNHHISGTIRTHMPLGWGPLKKKLHFFTSIRVVWKQAGLILQKSIFDALWILFCFWKRSAGTYIPQFTLG